MNGLVFNNLVVLKITEVVRTNFIVPGIDIFMCKLIIISRRKVVLLSFILGFLYSQTVQSQDFRA